MNVEEASIFKETREFIFHQSERIYEASLMVTTTLGSEKGVSILSGGIEKVLRNGALHH